MNQLILVLSVYFLINFNDQEKIKIPLIIDADTANEVDDLFALVGAMSSERLDIRGISSAQFHISPLASDSTVLESQEINERLVELANRKDIPLPIGSNFPLRSKKQKHSDHRLLILSFRRLWQ